MNARLGHSSPAARGTSLVGLIGSLSSCSTSLGAVTHQTLHPHTDTYVGISGSSIGSVNPLETPFDVAVGIKSEISQRTNEGTAWGDWRLQGLLGITELPRPHEFWLGYEGFLALGAGRYTNRFAEKKTNVASALGVIGGLPIRLSCREPSWRADDLVGAHFYLVPAAGVNALGLEQLEFTGTLSVRLTIWSAVTP